MEFNKYATQPQQQAADGTVADGTGHYSSPDENSAVSGIASSLGVADEDPLRAAIGNQQQQQQQPAPNEPTDLHQQAVDYASPVKPTSYYPAAATAGQYYSSPVKMAPDGYGMF